MTVDRLTLVLVYAWATYRPSASSFSGPWRYRKYARVCRRVAERVKT